MRRGVWIGIGLAAAAGIAASRGGDRPAGGVSRGDGGPIRVEVLNGSGIGRAGIALAEDLRSKGFDVVDIKNADRQDYAHTLVLDRVGSVESARAVSEAIGAADPVLQRNADLLLEVTVILGRDVALRGQDDS